jgi:hypothetical protein
MPNTKPIQTHTRRYSVTPDEIIDLLDPENQESDIPEEDEICESSNDLGDFYA